MGGGFLKENWKPSGGFLGMGGFLGGVGGWFKFYIEDGWASSGNPVF
jgi:hypothetical protein